MQKVTQSGWRCTVALLTVHVDQETVEQIRQTALRMPWELVHVDYDNYFSAAKLPPLTQRAINTQACVAVVDFDGDPERALETAEFLRQSFYHNIGILALSSTTDPDLAAARDARRATANFWPSLSTPRNSRIRSTGSTNAGRPPWSVRGNAGKILSFFGAKGGVGTTTLAVHLAMFLVGLGKEGAADRQSCTVRTCCALPRHGWKQSSLL